MLRKGLATCDLRPANGSRRQPGLAVFCDVKPGALAVTINAFFAVRLMNVCKIIGLYSKRHGQRPADTDEHWEQGAGGREKAARSK